MKQDTVISNDTDQYKKDYCYICAPITHFFTMCLIHGLVKITGVVSPRLPVSGNDETECEIVLLAAPPEPLRHPPLAETGSEGSMFPSFASCMLSYI